MKNYATTGFLSTYGRTITFTISLDKPVINAFVSFSKMDVEIRKHDSTELIVDEDIMINDNYTVITQVKSLGIEVTLTQASMFTEADNIPLSVYIKEANAEFYNNFDEEETYNVTYVSALSMYVKSLKSNKNGTHMLPTDFDASLTHCYYDNNGTLILDTEKQSDVEQSDADHKTIIVLKKQLADTDYMIIRTFEEVLSGINNGTITTFTDMVNVLSPFASDYRDDIIEREDWRDEIESLENTNS